MFKSKITTIILILSAVLLISFGISGLYDKTPVSEKKEVLITENTELQQPQITKKSNEETKSQTTQEETVEKKELENQQIYTDFVTLTIDGFSTDLRIILGQTLYEVLNDEENSKLISYSGKMYPGLGFFVTSIGKLKEGNGHSLVYYINGKEANLGVSNYIPQKGDIIEWKLTE